MQCQDIMRRPLEFVRSGETIAVAARKMRDANIGFLPVCTSSGEVRGVVTDRDLAVRGVAEELSPKSSSVNDVMTREVVFCRPDDQLTIAEQRMAEHRKSRVLVLAHNGRAVGVISLSDLAARRDPNTSSVLHDVAAREVLGGDGRRTDR